MSDTKQSADLQAWAAQMARRMGAAPARVANLPGSDAAVLKSIGDTVGARLRQVPGIRSVPGQSIEMYALRNFVSPDECTRLVEIIDASARPSTVLSATGDTGIRTSDTGIRTSETCDLPAEDPVVAAVERRIEDLLGIPRSHSEAIQGQRYRPGQQFKIHTDYFAPGQSFSAVVAQEGGQRTWTAMAFLAAPAAGGQTRFPRANVSVTPTPGALLIWNNIDADGHPNRFSAHEGTPVEAGTKYVLTKWFREREWKGSAGSDALRY